MDIDTIPMGGVMDPTIALSDQTRSTAGVLLISIVAIEFGGAYMVRLVRGRTPATSFQRSFARAGHAHAGVLVILALVCQLYADALDLNGFTATLARSGVAAAAIAMSAGFFLASAGRGRTEPNGLIALVYLGGVSLAAGSLALGIELVRA